MSKDRKRDQKKALKRQQDHQRDLEIRKPPGEVSPYASHTADEMAEMNPAFRQILHRIRRQKYKGKRQRPSQHLLVIPEDARSPRERILDKIATLVDHNAVGRSEMCEQFAVLLRRALAQMGTVARAVAGNAKYLRSDGTWFEWAHVWVLTDNGDLVDGNVDSLPENPFGEGLTPSAYWGPVDQCPTDRIFSTGTPLEPNPLDSDDIEIWWSELRKWLTSEESKSANG